jgi:hypothetical protein
MICEHAHLRSLVSVGSRMSASICWLCRGRRGCRRPYLMLVVDPVRAKPSGPRSRKGDSRGRRSITSASRNDGKSPGCSDGWSAWSRPSNGHSTRLRASSQMPRGHGQPSTSGPHRHFSHLNPGPQLDGGQSKVPGNGTALTAQRESRPDSAIAASLPELGPAEQPHRRPSPSGEDPGRLAAKP